MADPTSTETLLADLHAAHAPPWMLRKAAAGDYNDYLSSSPYPTHDLVCEACAANLPDIMRQAMAGKYDGTPAELAAWRQREGA